MPTTTSTVTRQPRGTTEEIVHAIHLIDLQWIYGIWLRGHGSESVSKQTNNLLSHIATSYPLRSQRWALDLARESSHFLHSKAVEPLSHTLTHCCPAQPTADARRRARTAFNSWRQSVDLESLERPGARDGGLHLPSPIALCCWFPSPSCRLGLLAGQIDRHCAVLRSEIHFAVQLLLQ
jgi:hypothetical protein